MNISIDKRSEVPARDQLRQQLIFLMSTGQLSTGSSLPSVRELARRLKIHHNTVSHVYSQLAAEGWLMTRRGSRLVVGKADAGSRVEDFVGLDDLIDRAIRLARTHGYSLQQLRARVRERLMAEPADHLLLVAPEQQLAELIAAEIAEAVGAEPDICSVAMLQRDPSLAIGAALVTPAYHRHKVEPWVSADRTLVSISYSPADEHITAIRELSESSVVGVVSISELFLETANGLLAPAIGRRHSFRGFLLKTAPGGRVKLEDHVPNEASPEVYESWLLDDSRRHPRSSGRLPSADLKGVDLLLCDSVAHSLVNHKKAVRYRLVSSESLSEVANTMNGVLRQGQTLR